MTAKEESRRQREASRLATIKHYVVVQILAAALAGKPTVAIMDLQPLFREGMLRDLKVTRSLLDAVLAGLEKAKLVQVRGESVSLGIVGLELFSTYQKLIQ